MKTLIRSAFIILLAGLSAVAGESSPQTSPVDPQKGSVSESGKFELKTTADAAPTSAPDPAERLAGIELSQDNGVQNFSHEWR
jgi:hypothetical protein